MRKLFYFNIDGCEPSIELAQAGAVFVFEDLTDTSAVIKTLIG